MVTGGEAAKRSKLRSVEVLHSDGSPWCALPDLPKTRYAHTQTGLEACGGLTSDTGISYDDDMEYDEDFDAPKVTCVRFSGGSWNQSYGLEVWRSSHSSWASPAGILIMGAERGPDTKTTEILNDSHDGESVPHFPLKYTIK